MIERFIVITNNTLSRDKLGEKYDTQFVSGDTISVLKEVRDYIHKGHRLLTHPLMSSIKPNETPYRTILISRDKNDFVDIDSLNIIENGIMTTEKFIKMFKIPNWDESILEDFKLIDYDLIYHAIN